MRAIPFYLRAQWFDPSQVGARVFPNWRLWGEYARSLRATKLRPGERLRCWLILARWPFLDGNGARLLMDVVVALVPGAWKLHAKAKAWRTALRSRASSAKAAGGD